MKSARWKALATVTAVGLGLATMTVAHDAAATAPGFGINDVAGTWAGLGKGTLQGQPFATNFILKIRKNGTATFLLDSTVGRVDATCTVTASGSGSGLIHCLDTSGPLAGVESDTRFVITDRGERLTGWSALPAVGFVLNSTAFRQSR